MKPPEEHPKLPDSVHEREQKAGMNSAATGDNRVSYADERSRSVERNISPVAFIPEYEISKPHLTIISTMIEEDASRRVFHPDYYSQTDSSPVLNAKYEFLEKRERLQADATQYFEQLNEQLNEQSQTVLPDRENILTKIAQLPAAGMSQPELIRHVMPLTEGLVLGEAHADTGSKQFLIDNMAEFYLQGVRTLYMEHLLSGIHQESLDEYFLSPEGEMPALLKSYLTLQDAGHSYGDPNKKYNFLAVIEAAHQAGIRIVAIDCTASYQQAGINGNGRYTTRQEMMNYFAEKIIRHYQSFSDAGKWVALTGNSHMNTFQNVYGLAELTGTIGLRIEDGLENKVASTDPGFSAGRKYNDWIVKGDLLLTVKSEKKIKLQRKMKMSGIEKKISMQMKAFKDIPLPHEIDSYAAIPMKPRGETYRALLGQLKMFWNVAGLNRLSVVVNLCELSANYLEEHRNDFSFFSRNGKIHALKNSLDNAAREALISLEEIPKEVISSELKSLQERLQSLYPADRPDTGAVLNAARETPLSNDEVSPSTWRWREGHLSVRPSDPVHNSGVEEWALPPRLPLPAVNSNGGGETRYEKQLIIQLENDVTVADAAAMLAGKNANSLLVQMDKSGHYRVVKKNAKGEWSVLFMAESAKQLVAESAKKLKDEFSAMPGMPGDEVRWQIVGHGRQRDGAISKTDNSTLAGHTPKVLSQKLKQLITHFGITLFPTHISLVSCALTRFESPESSFAWHLMEELPEVKSLSARVEPVTVDQQGRKFSAGKGAASGKAGKILFYREEGELKTRAIHETHPTDNALAAAVNRISVIIRQLSKGEKLPYQLTADEQQLFSEFFRHADGSLDENRLIGIATNTKQGNEARDEIQALVDTGYGPLIRDLDGAAALASMKRVNSEIWAIPDDKYNRGNFRNTLFSSSENSVDLYRLNSVASRLALAARASMVLGITGLSIPALGLGVGIGSLSANRRLIRSGLLGKEKVSELEAQNALTIAGMSIDFGGDTVSTALGQWDAYLARSRPAHAMMKPLARDFRLPPALLTRLSEFSAASKAAAMIVPKYTEKLLNSGITRAGALAGTAGSLLNLAGVALSWYAFHQIAEELKTETDSARKTDLYVNAGLTLTGAITTTVTAGVITAAAVGAITGAAFAGSAASLAAALGPLGLALGAATLVAGWIYNGIRQVEKIGKAINLNEDDKFRIGFLALFGSLPADIENRRDFTQAIRQANRQHKQLLENNPGIDALYHTPVRIKREDATRSSLKSPESLKKMPELVVDENISDYIDLQHNRNIFESNGCGPGVNKMYTPLARSKKVPAIPKTAANSQAAPFMSNGGNGDAGIVRVAPFFRDMDNDGYEDKVSINDGKITIRYGGEEGFTPDSAFFSMNHSALVGQNDLRFLAGDVNGDGLTDLVIISKKGRVSALLNGAERSSPFVAVSRPADARLTRILKNNNSNERTGILLSDMNNDGLADLVVVEKNFEITVALGRPNGQFGKPDTRHPLPGEGWVSLENHRISGLDRTTNTVYSIDNKGDIYRHRLIDNLSLVMLGNKDDTFLAPNGWYAGSYFIDVGSGKKKFIAGPGNDVFSLKGDVAAVHGELNGAGGEDTVSLSQRKYGDGEPRRNAIINLGSHSNSGYIRHTEAGKPDDATAPSLILKNIENADGHDETNDTLLGNDVDNRLNGLYGKSIIKGFGGNDDIVLSEGMATGGTGNDRYRILANRMAREAEIVLKENNSSEEQSLILIDQKISQLRRPLRNGDDLVISLCNDPVVNDDGTLTAAGDTLLRVSGFYVNSYVNNSAKYDAKIRVRHTYSVQSSDGFRFTLPIAPEWPSSAGKLAVQYDAASDRNWQELAKNGYDRKKMLIELSNAGGRGTREIFSDHLMSKSLASVQLPEFMQLSFQDTVFNERMSGDSADNLFRTSRGNDCLAGGGGNNEYIIDNNADNNRREITIIPGVRLAGRVSTGIVELPWSVENTTLKWADSVLFPSSPIKDLVLSSRDFPENNPQIRIAACSSGRANPVSLRNKLSAELFTLEIVKLDIVTLDIVTLDIVTLGINANDSSACILNAPPGPAEDNPLMALYAATKKILLDGRGRTGNTRIRSESAQGAVMHGGDENNLLVATAGDNEFYGNRMADEMYSADGNDTYWFDAHHGHDVITDTGGNDTLRFTSKSVTPYTMVLYRVQNDLKIIFRDYDDDSVTIKNYYHSDGNRIEHIQAGQYKITGPDISSLASAMASFGAPERPDFYCPAITQTISDHWQLIPPH